QRQFDLGSGTQLQLLQAQALLESTRANLPSLEKGFYIAVYALATLLAEPAQPLMTEMERGAAQPRPRGNDATGVPADILRNRPDVRSAERSLAAAVAAVGVSTADLYPSVNLSGNVTAGSSHSWSFGPSVSLPVLNQPLLRANRDAAVSAAKQAELGWRGTVLAAVEDVQAAQAAVSRDRRQVAALGRTAEAYARARDLSRETYEVGTTSFLDFLDSERSMGDAQLSVASSVRTLANDWTSLQIATGRGWATAR
ncbi:TolC family protein, partial [Haematobacter sp. UBA3484]